MPLAGKVRIVGYQVTGPGAIGFGVLYPWMPFDVLHTSVHGKGWRHTEVQEAIQINFGAHGVRLEVSLLAQHLINGGLGQTRTTGKRQSSHQLIQTIVRSSGFQLSRDRKLELHEDMVGSNS